MVTLWAVIWVGFGVLGAAAAVRGLNRLAQLELRVARASLVCLNCEYPLESLCMGPRLMGEMGEVGRAEVGRAVCPECGQGVSAPLVRARSARAAIPLLGGPAMLLALWPRLDVNDPLEALGMLLALSQPYLAIAACLLLSGLARWPKKLGWAMWPAVGVATGAYVLWGLMLSSGDVAGQALAVSDAAKLATLLGLWSLAVVTMALAALRADMGSLDRRER